MTQHVRQLISALSLTLALTVSSVAQTSHLYPNGTNWDDAFYDIVNSSDTSTFETATFDGVSNAMMWDRDINSWITIPSYTYTISFKDSGSMSIRIRQADFSQSQADELTAKYGHMIGQLPKVLRLGNEKVNILKSDALFGGNAMLNAIEITIGATSILYEQTGNLEETIIHEMAHSAVDDFFGSDWQTAQIADGMYISKYARDYPTREDMAESFVAYLAIKFRQDRMPTSDYDAIVAAIPNRIAYFDSMNFDVAPLSNLSTALDFDTPKTTVRPATISIANNRLHFTRSTPYTVTIFMANGKAIRKMSGTASLVSLNSLTLAKGIYQMRVVQGDETFSEQFIVR